MDHNRLKEKIERNAKNNLDVANLRDSIVLGTSDGEDEPCEDHLLRSAKKTYRRRTNQDGLFENNESPRDYIVEIARGKDFFLVLSYVGLMFGWGRNNLGQLGLDSDKKNVPRPELIKSSELFESIKCGRHHSLALTKSGKVFQFGFINGQKFAVPTWVAELEDIVVAIECGQWHSIALTRDKRVYTWGCNKWGQLGLGEHYDKVDRPIKVNLSKPVQSIAVGYWHSLFLTENDEIFGCGRNEVGQVDCNSTEDKMSDLRQISGTIRFKAIRANQRFSVGFTSTGDRHCWGIINDETVRFESVLTSSTIGEFMLQFATFNSKYSVSWQKTVFQKKKNKKDTNQINSTTLPIDSEPSQLNSGQLDNKYCDNSDSSKINENPSNIERDQAVQSSTTSKIQTKTENVIENSTTKPDSTHSKESVQPISESNPRTKSLKNKGKNKKEIVYGKELKSLEQNQVIDKESSEMNSNLVESRLLTGNQLDSTGYLVKTVYILVIDDQVANDDVTKAQPNYQLILTKIKFVTIRLALLFALKMKFRVKKFEFSPISSDSKLKTNENSDIYLKIKDNNETICFRNLKKPMECLSKLTQFANSHGLIYHSNYLQSLFKSGQFDQSSLEPSLYFHESGQTFLIVYFDEILVFGNSDHVENFLKTNSVWFNDLGEVNGEDQQKFCNVNIQQENNNQFRLNQQDSIDKLLAENKDVLDEFSRKGNVKTSISPDKPNLDKPSQPNSNNPVGRVVPQLDHIANTTRPDVKRSTNFLMLNIGNTSETIWNNTIQLLQYLMQPNPCSEILNINLPLEIFVDSSAIKSANIDEHTGNNDKCSSAIVVRWHGCVIWWQTLFQSYESTSNIEAKLYATIVGVKYGYGIAQLIQQFENFATKTSNKNAIALDCRYLSQTPPSPSLTRLPLFTVQCNYNKNFEFFDDKIGNKELLNFIRWHHCQKTFRQNNKPQSNLATKLIPTAKHENN